MTNNGGSGVIQKICIVIFAATFLVQSILFPVQAAKSDLTSVEKLTTIEQAIYGTEQTGSLLERGQKVEKEIFGLPGKESLVSKIDKIYTYTLETQVNTPSLLLKLNALEWTLNKTVFTGAAKTRIENLEKLVAGVISAGPIDARLARLLQLATAKGKLELTQATLPKDTLVKISIKTALNTKASKVGDPVEFEAAEDVYAAGALVIPKGAVGKGRVAKVEAAQNFGRDAKLEVAFESIQTIDTTIVPTYIGEKAKQETQSMAKAAGAALVGVILLGPIGVVGSAFVHGKNITIPPGTLLYIQTQNDADITGIVVK